MDSIPFRGHYLTRKYNAYVGNGSDACKGVIGKNGHLDFKPHYLTSVLEADCP